MAVTRSGRSARSVGRDIHLSETASSRTTRSIRSTQKNRLEFHTNKRKRKIAANTDPTEQANKKAKLRGANSGSRRTKKSLLRDSGSTACDKQEKPSQAETRNEEKQNPDFEKVREPNEDTERSNHSIKQTKKGFEGDQQQGDVGRSDDRNQEADEGGELEHGEGEGVIRDLVDQQAAVGGFMKQPGGDAIRSERGDQKGNQGELLLHIEGDAVRKDHFEQEVTQSHEVEKQQSDVIHEYGNQPTPQGGDGPFAGDEVRGDGQAIDINQGVYFDMCGKQRSFTEELFSFVTPLQEQTPPPTFIDLVSIYVIRSEARRVFPRKVCVSWLTDFFASTWIQNRKDIGNHQDSPSNPLKEHDRSSLINLLKKQYTVLPLFADNCYSLIAFEGVSILIDFLSTFTKLESNKPKTSDVSSTSASVAQRVKCFETLSHIH